jgi:hypothetical protein
MVKFQKISYNSGAARRHTKERGNFVELDAFELISAFFI